MGLGSERGWETGEGGRPASSLLVELRQRSYVLPWSLFLGAEGTEAEVRLTFHTHLLDIQGAGLSALLVDLAGQRVTRLREPGRTEKFSEGAGPQITALSVTTNQ